MTVAMGGLVIFPAESMPLVKARGRTLNSWAVVLLESDTPPVEDVVAHGLSLAHGLNINDLKVKPLMLVIVAVL